MQIPPLEQETASAASPVEEVKIADETLRVELEESDSLDLDQLLSETMEDFPDQGVGDEIDVYAAAIARGSITEQTRRGHYRHVFF
jgi:hypothetical protein